jgi:hypothetical protein
MDLSSLQKCREYRSTASGLLVKQFSSGKGQQRNGDEPDQPNYDVPFDLHRAPPLRSTEDADGSVSPAHYFGLSAAMRTFVIN